MTRSDVHEIEHKRVVQDQVSTLQKNTADQSAHFQEINDDLRSLNGRIEVVENKVNLVHSDKEKSRVAMDQQIAELNRKVTLLQEEITKIETQIQGIGSALETSKAESKENKSPKTTATVFDQAEDSFQKKDWANAILKFSEYREANPKGKKYSEATFKIGMSFELLGKKKDAKVFYDEILEHFSKTPFAAKSRERLKKMK